MNAFNRLPGFTRSPPGLEQRLWRRLPFLLLWGTMLPLGALGLHGLLSPDLGPAEAADAAALQWQFMLLGVVAFHWTMVLTVGLGCLIVRIMKGPAYVADAYPAPHVSPLGPIFGPPAPPARDPPR